jgi:AhpD family alkylhydroperoxidase
MSAFALRLSHLQLPQCWRRRAVSITQSIFAGMSHISPLFRHVPETRRKDPEMTGRINPYTAAPELLKAWLDFSNQIAASGLEAPLLELVKIRASQINACANCLNMHTYEARRGGETEQRLAVLAAWREAPLYTDRERAALDWTEHLTLVSDKRAPQDVYAALDAQFSKEEQVKLTMAINVINGWNRLAVGFDLFAPELGWKP